MTSESLSFIPRKVGKPKPSASLSGSAHTSAVQPSNEDVKGKSKALQKLEQPEASSSKRQHSDQDILTLMSLALSDHGLWLNSDIRRKMDDSANSGGEGFVNLSYVLNHSPVLTSLAAGSESETAIVKALRRQPPSENPVMEVRMMLKKPDWHNWGKAKSKDQKDTGMYEIRRKDWEALPSTRTRCTREYWEQRTVYMENIPVQYKSATGIACFAHNLIAPPSIDSAEPLTSVVPSQLYPCPFTIQAVTLPPHYLDKSGGEPKCKGFAFVTLSNMEDAKRLSGIWPWERNQPDSSDIPERRLETDEAKEAQKFGFRCLSKTRWDALKDEYLAYRENLVKELVAFEDEHRQDWQGHDNSNDQLLQPPQPPQSPAPRAKERHASSYSLQISPFSPFPPSCLVFVRNIHPETNKTTLKTLFSKAFSAPRDAGIDYVDFNKGMHSCYLRLATPLHAHSIVEYLTKTGVNQTSGLDASGSPATASASAPPITAELVLERKEEIYWEKVPLKVRSAAVQKYLEAMEATKSGSGTRSKGTTAEGEDGVGVDHGDGHGRKRRKKNR
ncbi:hypothetical protein Moror_9838 [Moniliophthora roreri MCA 2997]|uniref:XRRM domain-containing protein n=2 Tax=Moniliophthora roreri TaxID=221103 RepID=V2WI36_MONRO|nr:hypothetical protein Moror_9838 [Moniliophthora roreri MCA 2997]KAI3598418.1 hypothetical protein WG66_000689 [Moniliophthora roreri]